MTLYDYFKRAHQLGFTYKRHWLLRAFTIQDQTQSGQHREPGDFWIEGDKALTLLDDGEVDAIEPFVLGEPLYTPKTPCTLQPGDYQQITEVTESFYSTLLTNLLIFEFPFGGTIPYQNKRLNGKTIDKLVVTGMKAGDITPAQRRKHSLGLQMLTVLTAACVPSATRKALIPPADIAARRDALLEKYKDQLDDPHVIAMIEKELVDYYREYVKGDPIEEFYMKDKNYDVSLKRSHMMFGGEPRLDDPSKFDLATPSLREGWRIEDLPMMINSLRMGSFNRGAQTALGGEAAKFSARIFQNTKLTDDDCGSTVGMPFRITPYNKDKFNGRWRVTAKGLVKVEAGDLDTEVGKLVSFRSPQTCWTGNGNYCKVCMGTYIAESGIGLGTQASEVGSQMLKAFLALMHATKVETRTFKIRDLIS